MTKKNSHLILIIFLLLSVNLKGKSGFDNYFLDKTLRIDYFHSGNAKEESIIVDNIYIEGKWSGNKSNLIFPFKYGRYRYEIYSSTDKNLIFSKNFDSYFGEYKTTNKALKGVKKIFHETALLPLPRRKVDFILLRKDRNNRFHVFFKTEIDSGSPWISDEKKYGRVKITNILKSGEPASHADIAIIAEGYTKTEYKKAVKDFKKAGGIFFSQEPYKSLKSRFNLYGIFKSSSESGTDEPRQRIFRNTSVDTSFNSMNSPRYLLTESNKKLRDIASAVPYDALIIMVNSKRYGGGGIFNLYCTFTIDSNQTPYLLMHEFGHSFSGLADEYYSSAVSYNDFYPRGVEPDEPNITALLNPKDIKWKNLVTEGTALPTSWKKQEFDRMNDKFSDERAKINREIDSLTEKRASKDEIKRAREKLNNLIKKKEKEDHTFFLESKSRGVVGAFQGAGYSSKGLYRSMVNCIMFTIGKKPYCKVCKTAVEKMIEYYSGQIPGLVE